VEQLTEAGGRNHLILLRHKTTSLSSEKRQAKGRAGFCHGFNSRRVTCFSSAAEGERVSKFVEKWSFYSFLRNRTVNNRLHFWGASDLRISRAH